MNVMEREVIHLLLKKNKLVYFSGTSDLIMSTFSAIRTSVESYCKTETGKEKKESASRSKENSP